MKNPVFLQLVQYTKYFPFFILLQEEQPTLRSIYVFKLSHMGYEKGSGEEGGTEVNCIHSSTIAYATTLT